MKIFIKEYNISIHSHFIGEEI